MNVEPAAALADLTEISSQVEAAVLVGGDGEVLASTLADEARARDLAAAATDLLTAAESLRGTARQELVQAEAATSEGSLFVVREGGVAIAATTAAAPTVGLVFYDLKTCVRSLAGDEARASA